MGIIGGEKESEQGLHFTSSPIGSPCHTNANDSAPGPPLIKTQSTYSKSNNKNCLKYSFMPRTVIDWNSIPLHIKEIEDKDKFKAAVAQYFSQ